MIEIEKTYLAKYLPDNLKNYEYKEIVDIYLPTEHEHPTLRIRKTGDSFEMTKKEPVKGRDSSRQLEQTITLREDEYRELAANIKGKRFRKLRYRYPHNNGLTAEFDVFQDDLKGLVIIDFEFETVEAKDNFPMPDFCLADVTQEKFIAGGMLCGKKYQDIEKELEKYNYQKLSLNSTPNA